MAGKEVDVFGFDELKKAFERVESKYDSQADALLAAQATQVQKRTRQKTGKVTGKLKRSWRALRPKEYKGGTVKVSRVQSTAPHAHLYEYPHEVYTTRKNRKTGKVGRYNETARRVMGIKSHGKTEGHYVLRDSMKERETRFHQSAEKMLEKVTEEVTV